MKKFFTLLLMLACAMFAGVSCVQDLPDGPEKEFIDEVTPHTFEIKFIEETLSCNYAEFYCEPANKTKLYMMVTDQELDEKPENSKGSTPKQRIQSYLNSYVNILAVFLPADNSLLFKGSNYTHRKLATRVNNDTKVKVYVVGVDVTDFEPVMNSNEKMVLAAELSTDVLEVEVPFKPYPVITLGNVDKLSCEEGSTSVACTLENELGSDFSLVVESSAKWVVPTYENGNLTLKYERNQYAIARTADITVDYGRYVEMFDTQNKPYEFWESYVTKQISVTQDKDHNAPVYTFELKYVSNSFCNAVVDVIPSHKDVDYIVRVATANSDWSTIAPNNMRYPEDQTYMRGDKEGLSIKVSSLSLGISDGAKYYVYAFAVNEAHTAAISEVSKLEVTHNTEDAPELGFAVVTLEETAGRYEVKVVNGDYNAYIYEAGEVRLPIAVTNEMPNAKFYYNNYPYSTEHQLDTTFSGDQFGVLGDDRWVKIVDDELVFIANPRPTSWSNSYDPYVQMSIVYRNDDYSTAETIKIRWSEKK